MGFVKLDRKFFDNAYWQQERNYSYAEAWLDLIQMARFDAKPYIKLMSNGKRITIKRGEIHASLRYLSTRWQWSVGKVKRFVDYHKKNDEIEHRTEQGESLLKLCNYDTYNPIEIYNETPIDTPTNTLTEQLRNSNGTPTDTNKKESKESKESKEERGKTSRFSPPTIQEVQNYISEKKYNHVNATRFCNFYESKGWMIGKNKMKNWKSAVSGWENRALKENSNSINPNVSGYKFEMYNPNRKS